MSTDCALVKKLYNAGYEVADHTQSHISVRCGAVASLGGAGHAACGHDLAKQQRINILCAAACLHEHVQPTS